MKKFIALLILVLTMASTTLAQADLCVRVYHPVPYQRVYVPAQLVRHWVPGYGWMVYHPVHRVLVWSRFYHRWM